MSEIVTQEELIRRRKLRAARCRKAEKHNVAIGFIGPNLELLKQANGQPPPQLPKRPKDAV